MWAVELPVLENFYLKYFHGFAEPKYTAIHTSLQLVAGMLKKSCMHMLKHQKLLQ